MAVATGSGSGLSFSRQSTDPGGLPAGPPTQWTLMMWFQGWPQSLFDIFDVSGVHENFFDIEHIFAAPHGYHLVYSGYDGTTFVDPLGTFDFSTLPDPTWYHYAWVYNAGVHTLYLTSEDHTLNLSVDLTTTFDALLPNLGIIDFYLDVGSAITNCKVWFGVNLTPTQIAQERDAYAVTNTTGIYAALNLSNDMDTADSSGQNHPFAKLGTGNLQTAQGPAILGGGGGTLPNTPSDVAIDMSDFEVAHIHWTDNSTNEDGFKIQLSVDNVVWGTVFGVGPNVTTITLSVSPDQLYFVRVAAFNLTGDSSFAVAGPAHSRQNLSIRLTSGPRSYLTIPDTSLAQTRTLAFGGAGPQGSADTNGNLTCEAYIRLDNTGSATIYSTIRHRAWPFQDDVRKTLPIPPPGLPPNVPPSGDTWEWAYLNPLFSYWWFGVRNGRLVCEVQDGRVTGFITTGPNPTGPADLALSGPGGSCVILDGGPPFGQVQPSAMFPPFSGTWHDCVSQWYIGIPPIFGIDPNVPPNCDFGFPALSAARDAQVGSYEITYLTGLPEPCFSIGSPTETTLSCDERPGFPAQTTRFYSAYPVGFGMPSVPPPGTSYAQKVTLTGPVIPVGKWTRVAWRWVTTQDHPGSPQIGTSTLELWVGCEKMASTTIPVNSRADGYSMFFLPYANLTVSPDAIGPGTRTVFVGGIPNPTLLAGQAPTAISLYDFKLFLGNPVSNPGGISEAHMAAECNCTAGQQPALWWKLRDATDLTNFGSDTPGAGLAGHPVGDTPVDGTPVPKNPCNVLENVPGPPQPPPSQHFRAAASIGLGGATPTTGCAVDDQKL